jgi:hypothetical protein
MEETRWQEMAGSTNSPKLLIVPAVLRTIGTALQIGQASSLFDQSHQERKSLLSTAIAPLSVAGPLAHKLTLRLPAIEQLLQRLRGRFVAVLGRIFWRDHNLIAVPK